MRVNEPNKEGCFLIIVVAFNFIAYTRPAMIVCRNYYVPVARNFIVSSIAIAVRFSNNFLSVGKFLQAQSFLG
jgi:hypothetical protein